MEEDPDSRLERAVSLRDKTPPYLQEEEEEEEREDTPSLIELAEYEEENNDSNVNKVIKSIPVRNVGTLILAAEMYMPLDKRQKKISGQLKQYVGSRGNEHILNNAWGRFVYRNWIIDKYGYFCG